MAADEAVVTALGPVRDALLATARRDAAATLDNAASSAARILADAAEEAAAVSALARSRGVADGNAGVDAERAHARREAHARVLAARREAYEELGHAAREAMAEVRADPGHRMVLQHMADAARRLLGPDVTLAEGDGGGVVGEAPGRRVDYSLRRYADRAVEAVAAAAEEEQP
jgi:vacuolar-type H+-ATPase subunit E/Vma4